MAKLLQTTITGSLNISGSSLVMPLLTGSTDVTSGSAGQLWINNEGALNLKFTQVGSYGSQNSPFSCLGAWSSGGAMSIARHAIGAGGTQNAAILFGGRTDANTDSTEEYDGASWSAGGSLITARAWLQGAGKQNSALAISGYVNAAVSCVEEYNGSSWASGGTVITARFDAGGAGVQNAALLYGGDSPSEVACTEEYNGSSWTAGGAMINARNYSFGTGTQTSAMVGRGNGDEPTEFYDGSSWSTGTNTINIQHQRAVAGTANAALFSGGNYPGENFVKFTEEWNGNTFSVGNDLLTGMAQGNMSCIGTINSAIVAGGYTPSKLTCTQEYTKNLLQPFTYDAVASTDSWSGGSNMIQKRRSLGGATAGTQNSSLAFGGETPTIVSCTEEFDGSSWSAGGALIIARNPLAGAGTQNAGLAFGGQSPVGTSTEEYGGTSWSAGNALINARCRVGGAGTQNEAVAFGGYDGGVRAYTEEYDGTNWSAGGAMITARYDLGGAGTQNALVAFGGANGPTSTEEYNGSSWSSAANITAIEQNMGIGTQNDALSTGGYTGGNKCRTLKYDGATYSTSANLPLAFRDGAAAGSPTAGIVFGGVGPSIHNVTQLFNISSDICSTTPYALCAWSNVDNLITARGFTAQGGTANAAFLAGGYNPSASSPQRVACNEEYNGTAFSAGGALITARGSLAGGGTQNAGIAMAGGAGGSDGLACTEEYDGSSFTAGGNMISGRQGGSGGGTQNAAVYTLGYAPPASVATTEHYNGSSWSSANDINNIRSESSFTGTQNSAVVMGGNPGPKSCVEEYDGTTWSDRGAMPTARSGPNLSGTQNDAIMAGGGESATSDAFEYNGISFNVTKKINTARFYGGVGSQGTANSHLFMGGRTPTYLSCVEEFTCGTTACIGAWNTIASINIGRASGYAGGGGGAVNAGILAGGVSSQSTELYNGFSWSRDADVPLGGYGVTAGTQDAHKQTRNSADIDSHLDYNGTAWSHNTCSPVGGRSASGAGTQNAFIQFGGFPGLSSTETWNGSAWSSGGTMINAMYYNSGAGTVNDAASIGGYNGAYRSCHEKYNGSTWSTSTANNYNTGGAAGSGNDTEGYFTAGGSSGTDSSLAYLWNGYAWESMSGGMAHARSWPKGNGNGNGGLVISGEQNSSSPDTESWTCSNPVNLGLYCFVKNLAPGTTDSVGTSYSTGY